MKNTIFNLTILFTITYLFLIQFIYFNNKIDDKNETIKIEREFLTFGKTGQIFTMSDGTFGIYSFVGKNLEICGQDIIINAGDKKIELRVGNTNKIEITKDKINFIGNVYINNNLIK